MSWLIESGGLNSSSALIGDLLTVRADPDRYYFGMDVFAWHSDFFTRLCDDAPSLLFTWLDGLIWRSRVQKQGRRRVSYCVRHLIRNEGVSFSKTLVWCMRANDPTLVCHSVLMLLSDTIWNVIADKIHAMVLVLYCYLVKVRDEISAPGLRRVGYAIVTELFGPFATACAEAIHLQPGANETVIGAFCWSLSLVAQFHHRGFDDCHEGHQPELQELDPQRRLLRAAGRPRSVDAEDPSWPKRCVELINHDDRGSPHHPSPP